VLLCGLQLFKCCKLRRVPPHKIVSGIVLAVRSIFLHLQAVQKPGSACTHSWCCIVLQCGGLSWHRSMATALLVLALCSAIVDGCCCQSVLELLCDQQVVAPAPRPMHVLTLVTLRMSACAQGGSWLRVAVGSSCCETHAHARACIAELAFAVAHIGFSCAG
jgi:hypothetical protein